MASLGPRPKDLTKLKRIAAPHLDSFNYFLREGMHEAVANLDPVELEHNGLRLHFMISDVQVDMPTKKTLGVRLYPAECRQLGITYDGPLRITVVANVIGEGGTEIARRTIERNVGRLPIMVGSSACNLHGLSPQQLVHFKEEAHDFGGYFIVNGNEKIVRLLIAQRRNYPMCYTRSNYARSGPNFSEHAINIRCVRNDQSSQSFTIHYLNNGDCMLRFAIRKQSYFLPVLLVLRALVETTDREIYERIIEGDTEDTFITDRVEMMLRESKKQPYYTREEALAHIGAHFRAAMDVPKRYTDVQVGQLLLQRYICVHLDSDRDKFNLIILMVRKLYYLANGQMISENADSAANQEVLVAGHLFCAVLKEKLQEWLQSIKALIQRDIRLKKGAVDLADEAYFRNTLAKGFDIGRKLEYLLATGNLISPTGLDLKQASGFTIVAEKLNFLRYIAHFRCIHRGQFFTEMRTTAVRKLLPDSWGFICPVHTPDGAPCGLLNHLAEHCSVTTTETQITDYAAVTERLCALGMRTSSRASSDDLPVVLDGRVVGYVHRNALTGFEAAIRTLKSTPGSVIPRCTEIATIVPGKNQFPAVYLFSGPARFIRPVHNLHSQATEHIGSFEQPYLSVAVRRSEVMPHHTHVELQPTNMLSILASMTPFCDYNQSPRNMYQCQMAKQTMGTPVQSWPYRSDNKLFRIQSPQTPIVRNATHDEYHIDEYLTGTNAVVAVLAYTGYDMEDAMIINKSSFERGFGHGFVYKTEIIDLSQEGKTPDDVQYLSNTVLNSDGEPVRFNDALEEDGLPAIGTKLSFGDPLYVKWDNATKKHVTVTYKGKEDAIVEQITALGFGDTAHLPKDELTLPQKFSIKYRINRRPTRGDKFSSRHGQKGVLSQLWPQIDFPFSESGMTPDVLINPNAFPSRMTIGMLIESMAGKAGALHGVKQDATPFTFDEQNRAIDYFGKQLLQAGYNYWGNETFYSGITGEEFKADIYFGIVYYQRLRHMVGDKYQVRSTGPRNRLTRQPIKGRKKGGGIRFGEMERDSLLGHGTAFLLHDRLMMSSDYHRAHVCVSCGSLLSPTPRTDSLSGKVSIECIYCKHRSRGTAIKEIALPYVTRYLANELAAMNIRLTVDVSTCQ